MTTKLCNKCGITKDETEFAKYRNVCKECRKKYRLERYQKKADELRQYAIDYRANNLELVRERARQRYKDNPAYKEYAYKWREANPEKVEAIRQKFLTSLKGKLYSCKNSHIRRIRGKKIEQVFTAEEWQQKIWDTFGICPECGIQFTPEYLSKHEVTIDHIVPLSKAPKGFIYTIDDVQPLCRSCNSKKYNKVNKHG